MYLDPSWVQLILLFVWLGGAFYWLHKASMMATEVNKFAVAFTELIKVSSEFTETVSERMKQLGVELGPPMLALVEESEEEEEDEKHKLN